MKLTEFLVRTKSSTLICRLPESFGFSSAFLGRAMMKFSYECCSVNKRMCAWRVSAVRVFSGRNFGGQVPLRGTSLMAGNPLATPKLAYRRASRLLTPHWCHYPKRDSPNCRFLSISAPDFCIETGRTLARNALILLRQGFSPYHTFLKQASEPHLK